MTPRFALLLVIASSACHASEAPSDPNVGPPTIASQPVDKAVSPGQAATFMVRASGEGSLSYQWRRNGIPIDAATLPVYATEPTALGDDGATIDVVVKDLYGSVTSRPAKLSVHEGGPKTLTLHTTDGAGHGDAPFVAFQDGDGPWQAVTPDPNGDHAFTVTDERYGVAVGDPTAGMGFIFQGTVAEVEDLFLPVATVRQSLHPAFATLAGVRVDHAFIAGCQGTVPAPGGPVVCILPPGVNDLVAVEAEEFDPTAIVVQRGAWIFDTGASSLGLFDFTSSRAFVPESHTLTIHGVLPGAFAGGEAGLRLRSGAESIDYSLSQFGQFTNFDNDGALLVPIRQIPPTHLAPGDVQFASVRARLMSARPDQGNYSISYSEWFTDTGDRIMTFPTGGNFIARVDPPSVPSAQWVTSSGLLFTLNATTNEVAWACGVSRGWLGALVAPEPPGYQFPDLSAVAGWSSALAFRGHSLDIALRADSYIDVKRSLAFALYGNRAVPPRGDATRSVLSILEDGATFDVP